LLYHIDDSPKSQGSASTPIFRLQLWNYHLRKSYSVSRSEYPNMIKNGCHDADKLYDRMRVDASLKLSQIMSVKFAPEPHLHAQSRTISSLTVNTQTKAESSKGTHQRDSAPSSPVRSILGTPLTESPISTNAPHRFVYICGQEAERQPLLPSSQAPAIVNKASRFWPIAFGVLVMLALALLVIIGGWRLGKGAGGGRWPGGPA
jgi:hypothetical protein